MSGGMALLAGAALVGGCALILVAALVLAVLVWARIDPGPEPPLDAQVERAERFRREAEGHEAATERRLERRGREQVVWSRATVPAFLIVFVVFMLIGAWSAVAEHADAGGGPVPVPLLLRPLWLPWVPALLTALVGMAERRRNWERWPQWKRDLERERHRKRRRSGARSRVEGLRRAARRRAS